MTTLDSIGWSLLNDLQENARLPYAELGRRVGLSLPAVAERIRRMEDSGIILGYRAEVSPERIGFAMTVFIQLQTAAHHYAEIEACVEAMPEVLECHHITGVDSFLIKAVVDSRAHLERVVSHLSAFGQTTTSLVLSTPVSRKVLGGPSQEA